MGYVCRALVAQHGDAVVRVKITFKESVDWGGMSSDSSEWTSEIPGTVVAPDGTTVVSLYNTDPSAMFEDFITEMEDDDVDFEVTLTGVEILLASGKEVPAKVVLRGQDLDLAILKPENRLEHAVPFIDLKQAVEDGFVPNPGGTRG
jgi:S1-C subfamily serine protease